MICLERKNDPIAKETNEGDEEVSHKKEKGVHKDQKEGVVRSASWDG